VAVHEVPDAAKAEIAVLHPGVEAGLCIVEFLPGAAFLRRPGRAIGLPRRGKGLEEQGGKQCGADHRTKYPPCGETVKRAPAPARIESAHKNKTPRIPGDNHALSAEYMVASRKGVGGTQPDEVRRMLGMARGALREDEAWAGTQRKRLSDALAGLEAAFARVQ
jgi:hypothetical protein